MSYIDTRIYMYTIEARRLYVHPDENWILQSLFGRKCETRLSILRNDDYRFLQNWDTVYVCVEAADIIVRARRND